MFEKICRRRKGKRPGFRCVETGLVYEEFLGGFSWPAEMPGFVCVVGQIADSGKLQIMQEVYEDILVDLSRRCGAFQQVYPLPDKKNFE
jgi:hypothetical protein